MPRDKSDDAAIVVFPEDSSRARILTTEVTVVFVFNGERVEMTVTPTTDGAVISLPGVDGRDDLLLAEALEAASREIRRQTARGVPRPLQVHDRVPGLVMKGAR